MPSSYMADCVAMTHAVLNQLQGFAADGSMVVAPQKKKKAAAARRRRAELPEAGAAARRTTMPTPRRRRGGTFAEVEFDFEKALYDFATNASSSGT